MKKKMIWGIGALLAASASGAQAAPPKKKPPQMKPAVSSGPAELALLSVTRLGSAAIYPGNPITVRLLVRNNGLKSARVATVLAPMYPGASPRRSAPVWVRARTTAQIDMRFPVEPRMVKGEQFRGIFLLADPRKPAHLNVLQQRWRDTNQRDNSKMLNLPVTVPYYDVTATLTEVFVYNDCNPGKRKSNWRAFLSVGTLPAAYNPTTDFRTASHQPGYRPGAQAMWPGPAAGNYALVTTAGRYPSRVKMRMRRVPKNLHIAYQFHAQVNNGPAYDARGPVGATFGTTPPSVWRNNGTTKMHALKLHDTRNTLGNCQPQPFTIKVRYTAIPTSMLLH